MTYTNPADFYDVSDINDNYSRLLFIAGRGLSAAELNGIQSLIRFDLASLGRYLVTNGTVITGGTVLSLTSNAITIGAASVFVDGHSIQVPSASVSITASGVEIVGMAARSLLVTDNDDPDIREPDPNSPNYGNAISYREKIAGRWCLSSQIVADESFFPIITLNNGIVVSVSHTGGSDNTSFENLLNAYDNETNGSYLLYGLNANFIKLDATNSPIIGISSGKGRVTGVPVTTTFQTTVALDPITDVRITNAEPYTYTGNATYALRYNPVSQIMFVQGIKQATASVTHGSYNGVADLLPNTPVASIISVTQGGTTYAVNTDYKQTGDTVDWSPTGSEPSPGSTYSVTYTYVSTFSPPMDVNRTGVVLNSSNVLVNNSIFYVTYYYFLKRIDRISLDKFGKFIVSRGTPSYSVYQTPPVQPAALSLATVNLINGQTPVITQSTTVNVDRNTLNNLINTVSNLQYSVATLTLTNSVRGAGSPTLATRQIFVDPLVDTSQLDLGTTNNLWITQGFAGIASNYSTLANSQTAYYLPYTESIGIDQPNYTGKQFINPYAVTTAPVLGTASLSPSSYTQVNNLDGGIQYVGTNLNPDAFAAAQSFAGGQIAWWQQNVPYEVNPVTTITSGSVLSNQPTVLTISNFPANDTVSVTFINQNYSVVTSASGSATVNLTVPANTPSGNYLALATSSLGTVIASATYSVNVTVSVLVYQIADPVATSLIPTKTFDIASVLVYVVDLPYDDIVVKLVGLTSGLPDSNNVFVTGRLAKANIVSGFNKVIFDYPWKLTAFGNYAIIVTTSRPQGTVGISTLGSTDILSNRKVTVDPAAGVLFTSANERTWTALQNQDLTFRAIAANYTTTPTTYILSTMTNLNSITDWNLSVQNVIPSGTNIRYYLQDSSGNQYDIIPFNWTYTVALSGTVSLRAVLTSNTSVSTPLILPGFVLYGGTAVTPGTYRSRQMPIANGVNSPATLTFVVDQITPSGTSILPYVQKADNTYAAMTFVSSTPIGNSWYEVTYTYTGLASANTRLQLTLNTTDTSKRPLFGQPRLIIN